MKKILFALFLVVSVCFVAIAFNSTIVSAVPSCTNWMIQTDGSYWRTCVGDDGKQYCEQSKNGTVSRVACK
jgi:hypothetical protein